MTQATVRGDIKSLAGKSFVYGLGSVLLKGLSFFLLPLYTRYLTPSDYGVIAVTTMVSVVLSILYPLGLHGALARLYFRAHDEAERRENSGTIWVAMILLAGGMTVLLDRLGGNFFPLIFREVPFAPYVRLSVWTAFFGTFGLLPLNLLQIQERPGLYVIATAASTLLTIGLIIQLVVFQKLGAYGYLLGALVANIVMAVPYVVLAVRYIKITIRWSVLSFALAYSLPLVPHGLAAWVLELSDRAILERFVSLGELGIYSLGYQLGTLMSIVATAINNAWVPFLFKTDSQQGEAAKERLARLVTYYVFFLCWIALGLSLLSKEMIALMTALAFHTADRVMPWIVWGWFFGGLYYVPINFMFVREKTGLIPVVTVVSGVANVGLNLLLVPRYGMMAAAWTTFLSYGLMMILAWRLASRVYPMPYEYGRLTKIAVAALCVLIAGNIASFPTMLSAMVSKGGLLFAFPAVLIAVGFFTPAEKAWVSSFTRRALKGGVEL